jgi:signal transduction histidine kinase
MQQNYDLLAVTSDYNKTSMLRTPIFRPLWLPTAITAVLLLSAIILMVGMSWRSMQRLQPVHEHLLEITRLQQAGLDLEEMLLPVLAPQLGSESIAEEKKIRLIKNQINNIMAQNTYLAAESSQLLNRARRELDNIESNPKQNLINSLASIRQVLATESDAHDKLMSKVRGDTELEFKIATSMLIVLPLLGISAMFLLRRHIFQPLSELATLMRLLAKQDFKPAASSTMGPILKPLFDNYNHMVSKLARLEQQNRARQESLENQVRSATHALLEHQGKLAAAERLAAVGELSAGLAHELRNPLAAMQLALSNLRQEMDNEDHTERLTLIVNELNRVTGLLNGMLTQTTQEPENVVEVNIINAVEELTTLAKYQINRNITLKQNIPADLTCRLPAGRLHQVVLNLLLNAAQAIGAQKGTIEISARRDDDQLILCVSDTGPGFPQSMLENGIRPFSSGRTGGTGLGLAIVQRFTRDLGGTIKLANGEHGAIVTLNLPCDNK